MTWSENITEELTPPAGAPGCLLASRLATTLPEYTMRLIHAGGENTEESQQTFGKRHWTLMTPGYNLGYETASQENLNGRVLDYSRGKGLGGSTATNFCVYTRGSSVDYDNWADLVGDDIWCWENARERFNKVSLAQSSSLLSFRLLQFERFHQPSKEVERFLHGSDTAHGFHGYVFGFFCRVLTLAPGIDLV